jgi:hypothetical protein
MFKTVTITYCPECFKYTRTEIICDHEFEPVAFTVSNGSVQIRMYCRKCNYIKSNSESHSKFDVAKLSKAVMDNYRAFWDDLCEKEFNKIREFTNQLNEKARNFERREYSEYLNSEWWRKRRIDALERDKYICQICGDEADEVHHMTYINRGNEYLFEIVSLCANCHKEYHLKLIKFSQ